MVLNISHTASEGYNCDIGRDLDVPQMFWEEMRILQAIHNFYPMEDILHKAKKAHNKKKIKSNQTGISRGAPFL